MRASTGGIAEPGRIFGPGQFIVLAVALLTGLGLVMLGSAGNGYAGGAASLFKKQTVWVGIAVFAGLVAWRVNLELLRKVTWPAYFGALALLGLVLVPGIGVEVNGARRWLDLGPMRLQVAEVLKIALVLALADYLALNQRRVRSFLFGFFVPSVLVVMPCALIMLQPDYGTAALCAAVAFLLLFLSGTRLTFLVPAVALLGALFCVAVYFDPVRLARVTAFLDVQANLDDGAWQLWQGMLAFGAGGVEGVGLGNGRQQLAFLPEAHTDFIFPIIGEELGLVFTFGVVLLFLGIFWAGLRTLQQAGTFHTFNLAAGALFFLVLQALINVGVVTGCLPTKGLSLPFISYGGSNLVALFVLVGLILNCRRHDARPALRRRRDL
jgi:cell division protein FtsW